MEIHSLADIAKAQEQVVAEAASGLRENMESFAQPTAEQRRAEALDRALMVSLADHSTEQILDRARAFLDFVTSEPPRSVPPLREAS